MARIDDLPALSEVIATHGLSAKKSLGQNFILDLNLTAKIARQAGDLTACDVLEIGPGPGGLTRGLLAEGARKVLAIEKDPRCMAALSQIAKAYPGQFDILNGDALEIDPSKHLTPPIRIVANLPYIATGDWRELHPSVREYEPRLALDSGPTGMELINELATQARYVLTPGGMLFLEFGYDQGGAVFQCLEQLDYLEIEIVRDLAGHERIAIATNP